MYLDGELVVRGCDGLQWTVSVELKVIVYHIVVRILYHVNPSKANKQAPTKKRSSHTGTRTRVAWVKATYPNHLDYMGARIQTSNTTYTTIHTPQQTHMHRSHTNGITPCSN
jgi:hypothetical protein